MDDYMMYEYLKRKGMGGLTESEFMNKFQDFMSSYRRNSMRNNEMPMDSSYRRDQGYDEFMDMFESRRDSSYNRNNYNRNNYNRNSGRNSMGNTFTESDARSIVAEMYHTSNGRKHSGEKYDMYKAKEVYGKYKGILPMSVTEIDVYIAINSQYHDYGELYKNWFGDNIDQKVFESAIVFWFKDADCKTDNKITEYFDKY